MGYISQASSSVADFSKCVISFLARVPTGIGTNVFEFGSSDASKVSYVGISSGGSLGVEFNRINEDYVMIQDGTPRDPLRVSVSQSTPGVLPAGNVWRRYIISYRVISPGPPVMHLRQR